MPYDAATIADPVGFHLTSAVNSFDSAIECEQLGFGRTVAKELGRKAILKALDAAHDARELDADRVLCGFVAQATSLVERVDAPDAPITALMEAIIGFQRRRVRRCLGAMACEAAIRVRRDLLAISEDLSEASQAAHLVAGWLSDDYNDGRSTLLAAGRVLPVLRAARDKLAAAVAELESAQ